jgi:hypothetical protein
MKKWQQFILIMFFPLIMAGQCPINGITLTTQAQVDAFIVDYPNCTEFDDILVVRGNDITNLYGLNNLIYVDHFLINLNPILENLEGLENLEYVSRFEIKDNDSLIIFSGLNSLSTVDNIFIQYCESLINLNGLESLTIVNSRISLTHLDSLESLEGLNNLSFVGWRINLNWNYALTSIEAINNMDPTEIYISSNISLSQCAIDPVCEQIDIDPIKVLIVGNTTGCNSIPEVEAQCLLSITEQDLINNISLYPIPVSSILKVDISENISFKEAIITSIIGDRVLVSSQKQINLENLPSGIYFCEVITDKGNVTKKILKE